MKKRTFAGITIALGVLMSLPVRADEFEIYAEVPNDDYITTEADYCDNEEAEMVFLNEIPTDSSSEDEESFEAIDGIEVIEDDADYEEKVNLNEVISQNEEIVLNDGTVNEEDLNIIRTDSLTLEYDDYYELDDEYVSGGYSVYAVENTNISSYVVENGRVTNRKDMSVITEVDGNRVRATGTGECIVYLIDETQSSIIKINVTVEIAPLAVFFLMGQSNMEGLCPSKPYYITQKSVLCPEGEVYSTFAPRGLGNGSLVAGVSFESICDETNADKFVAGALSSNKSIAGTELEYPIYSLTQMGGGKTGMDSGIAWKWNELTGEKVWVANTGYGGSSIIRWIPGGDCYKRTIAVLDDVMKTATAEVNAGHYFLTRKVAFWLQGEADETRMSAPEYVEYYDTFYNSIKSRYDFSYMCLIGPRARQSKYVAQRDLEMTTPRLAQYSMILGDKYPDIYMVTNENHKWMTDSGVASYFNERYPGGELTYPLRGGMSTALPCTVDDVHPDIHYTQYGHNENGITAAEGLYKIINNTTEAITSVKWVDFDCNEITQINIDSDSIGKIYTVPIVEPCYLSKQVSLSNSSPELLDYSCGIGKPLNNGEALMRAVTPYWDVNLNVYINRSLWKDDSNGRRYIHADGTYTQNDWEKIDGKYYRFDADGYLLTGWLKIGGNYYRTYSDGAVIMNDWVNVAGKYYRADTKGIIQLNKWVKVDGKYYRADSKGVIQLNKWVNVGGKYYRADSKGIIQFNKWINVNGKYYRADSKGIILMNTWVKVNGKYYRAASNGVIYMNSWIKVGGKYYRAASNGIIYMNKWIKVNGKYYFLHKDGHLARNEWIGKYHVNANGVFDKQK